MVVWVCRGSWVVQVEAHVPLEVQLLLFLSRVHRMEMENVQKGEPNPNQANVIRHKQLNSQVVMIIFGVKE